MPTIAAIQFESEIRQTPIDRAAVNRANSKHSTGPRTEAGKQRSSLNALRHGLTARTAVLDSENQADYENHHRQFVDQYKSANPTETHLVQELADTSWHVRRIPIPEANVFPQVPSPESLVPAPASTNAASSGMPPPSSNSINIKGFPGSPPTMASFFQKTKSNAALNA